MSQRTLFPPLENDKDDRMLPLELKKSFETVFMIHKEKRRLQRLEKFTHDYVHSSLDDSIHINTRSCEKYHTVFHGEHFQQHMEDDDTKTNENSRTGVVSLKDDIDQHSTAKRLPISEGDFLNDLYFDAAVATAMKVEKEIARWERGVAELEKIFNEECEGLGDIPLDIPLPNLFPVVENVITDVVETHQ